jgi:hypothetical protein
MSLEDKARLAFELSNDHNVSFMCGNQDLEFRGSIGGLLLMDLSDIERRRVLYELALLRALSAVIQGSPHVSLDSLPEEDEEVRSMQCGLMNLFQESRRKQ